MKHDCIIRKQRTLLLKTYIYLKTNMVDYWNFDVQLVSWEDRRRALRRVAAAAAMKVP